MKLKGTVGLAFAVVVLAATGSAANDARAQPGTNAKVVATKRVDDRLLELTVRTPALAADTRVRVLLPSGYAAAKSRRYPVLYLLHGASDNYGAWTRSGDVQRTTAGQPLIVVMPDGGRGGWYTNWYNGGAGGAPAWEGYHIGAVGPARGQALPDGRDPARAGDRGTVDGRLRRLQLRRAPPRPVHRRGKLLRRRST